jgi:hypothetical protein
VSEHPWSDGTTRVVFEPQTLLEKLAALISQGTVVRAILECLGLSAEAPLVHPARGPPELF